MRSAVVRLCHLLFACLSMHNRITFLSLLVCFLSYDIVWLIYKKKKKKEIKYSFYPFTIFWYLQSKNAFRIFKCSTSFEHFLILPFMFYRLWDILICWPRIMWVQVNKKKSIYLVDSVTDTHTKQVAINLAFSSPNAYF